MVDPRAPAYILTMVYTGAKMFRAGMERLHASTDLVAHGAQHVLLDQHWPLDYAATRAAIDEYVAAHPDTVLLDAGANLGLHRGLNYMVEHALAAAPDDAVIVAFDPDEAPQTTTWLQAMRSVMSADSKCGWLSLMNRPCLDHLDEQHIPTTEVAGMRLRVPGYSLMNVLCGWRIRRASCLVRRA